MTPANGPHQQLGFGFDVSTPAVARPGLGKRSTTADRDLATRPHTRLKLDSLRVYAPEWFGVMLNLSGKLGFRSAWFIDAFAGPGRFKDGAGTAPGSPVIACEAARDIAAEAKRKNRDFTPRLRFVEIDRRTRLQLADELKSFDGVVDYEIVAGDAIAKLPRLIDMAGSDPLLTFLDPDGFAPVTFELVARLGARRAITELLLSVDAHGLRRAQAAKETGALTAFSGGTWWQELLDGRGLLDVNAYLAELRRRIRDAGFTDVGYRHLRSLPRPATTARSSRHAGVPLGGINGLSLSITPEIATRSSPISFQTSTGTRSSTRRSTPFVAWPAGAGCSGAISRVSWIALASNPTSRPCVSHCSSSAIWDSQTSTV